MENYPVAVSVCDTRGTIIAINRLAMEPFSKYGGDTLIGTSLFNCRPEPANDIIPRLLREQTTNVYCTGKNGVRKLVHQAPWCNRGKFAGLTDTIIVPPEEVPTKQRG